MHSSRIEINITEGNAQRKEWKAVTSRKLRNITPEMSSTNKTLNSFVTFMNLRVRESINFSKYVLLENRLLYDNIFILFKRLTLETLWRIFTFEYMDL